MAGNGGSRLDLQVFRNPLITGCTFLWLLHTVWRNFLPEPWYFQYYLNDLLCMPIVLGAAIFLQRNLVLRQPDYGLTGWQIGIIVVYWSVMFEGVIPHFNSRYTADIFDVVAYAFGGLVFYRFGNSSKTNLVRKPA